MRFFAPVEQELRRLTAQAGQLVDLLRMAHDMAGPHRRLLYLGTVTALFVALGEGTILALAIPLAMGLLGADNDLGGLFGFLSRMLDTGSDTDNRISTILLLLGSLLIKQMAQAATTTVTQLAETRIVTHIRRVLIENTLAARFSFLDGLDKGWLQYMVSGLAHECGGPVIRTIFALATSLLTALTLIFFLFHLSTTWTLALIGIGLLVVPGKIWYDRKVFRFSRLHVDRQKRFVEFVHEVATNVRQIKIVNAHDVMVRDVVERSRLAKIADFYSGALNNWQPFLITLIAFSIIAAILASSRGTEIAGLLAFFLIVYRLLHPVTAMAAAFNNLLKLRPMATAIAPYFHLTEAQREPTGGREPGPVESLVVDRVSFAYQPGQPALSEVSVAGTRGEMIAIVGESGSGKSTLLHLLLALYEPTEGCILIDGCDLQTIQRHAWRDRVGLVSQHILLFNDTVENAIRAGRPDMPVERVRAAARAADAEGFILELEHGYQTVIGSGGQRLSGGQRQRLMLAQALARETPLLILDEATSALDPLSERRVFETLWTLKAGRIIVLVTHRLINLAHADRIYLLDRGRVAESGSWEDLTGRRGRFWTMLQTQMREGAPDQSPDQTMKAAL